MCVRVLARICVRVPVHASECRVYVRACMYVCVHLYVCVLACVHLRVKKKNLRGRIITNVSIDIHALCFRLQSLPTNRCRKSEYL